MSPPQGPDYQSLIMRQLCPVSVIQPPWPAAVLCVGGVCWWHKSACAGRGLCCIQEVRSSSAPLSAWVTLDGLFLGCCLPCQLSNPAPTPVNSPFAKALPENHSRVPSVSFWDHDRYDLEKRQGEQWPGPESTKEVGRGLLQSLEGWEVGKVVRQG